MGGILCIDTRMLALMYVAYFPGNTKKLRQYLFYTFYHIPASWLFSLRKVKRELGMFLTRL